MTVQYLGNNLYRLIGVGKDIVLEYSEIEFIKDLNFETMKMGEQKIEELEETIRRLESENYELTKQLEEK